MFSFLKKLLNKNNKQNNEQDIEIKNNNELIKGVWLNHDGGDMPVPGDTIVEIPSKTYWSTNGRNTLGPMRADSFEWNNNRVYHLRNEIQMYRILTDEEVKEFYG